MSRKIEITYTQSWEQQRLFTNVYQVFTRERTPKRSCEESNAAIKYAYLISIVFVILHLLHNWVYPCFSGDWVMYLIKKDRIGAGLSINAFFWIPKYPEVQSGYRLIVAWDPCGVIFTQRVITHSVIAVFQVHGAHIYLSTRTPSCSSSTKCCVARHLWKFVPPT